MISTELRYLKDNDSSKYHHEERENHYISYKICNELLPFDCPISNLVVDSFNI